MYPSQEQNHSGETHNEASSHTATLATNKLAHRQWAPHGAGCIRVHPQSLDQPFRYACVATQCGAHEGRCSALCTRKCTNRQFNHITIGGGPPTKHIPGAQSTRSLITHSRSTTDRGACVWRGPLLDQPLCHLKMPLLTCEREGSPSRLGIQN